jgi:organic hydroperoxide reductase OsmC/OhrA
MDAHYYHVDVNWQMDRKGKLCSPELSKENGACIEVATPPEFPKGMPGIWSAEHLFTAAVSSCLVTTFLSIAENYKLNFSSFSCPAKGKLEQMDGKFMMSEVILEPTVTTVDEKDEAKTLRILENRKRLVLFQIQ